MKMDSASTAFILICSALVFLMTPALAFFYGGLERRKNVLNTIMMVLAPLGLASLLWIILGYSLSFSGDQSFFGNLNHFFMSGVNVLAIEGGHVIPEGLFSAFQMMFSIIAAALITGAVVGRMRFTPLFIFLAIWLIVVYYPLAHMVWGGGFLAQLGSLDFAGGNVVHISSGISGLVLAIVLGPRRDYKSLEYRPHNIPFVVLGAGLLWFGWFGFNAGSSLAANGQAVQAFLTTNTAAAAAMMSWMLVEKIVIGKPSVIGTCTGIVVGLVAITPGAGYVSVGAALVIGALVSPISYFAISVLKRKIGYDDALDVFGCHGIGGIFGGIMTGVFASPSLVPTGTGAGLVYGQGGLFFSQIEAVVFSVIFSGLLSFIIIKVIAHFTEIRVSDRAEAQGLDDSEHNETAYPTFMGLDS